MIVIPSADHSVLTFESFKFSCRAPLNDRLGCADTFGWQVADIHCVTTEARISLFLIPSAYHTEVGAIDLYDLALLAPLDEITCALPFIGEPGAVLLTQSC